MPKLTIEEARRVILKHLLLARKWGESHTHYKHMLAGISREQRGSKNVRKAIQQLLAESKIILKKTTGEDHVSLNKNLSQEIKAEVYLSNMYINIQKQKDYIGGDST